MFRPLLPLAIGLILAIAAVPSRGADKKAPAEAVKISATDLMDELIKDNKAEAKYKGKTLEVEGKVEEVNKEAEVVILKGNRVTNVACEFPSSRKAQLAKLKVGQTVTIRGVFQRTVATGHADLDKCEVVK